MRAERCEHGGDSGIPSGLREPRGRRNFADPDSIVAIGAAIVAPGSFLGPIVIGTACNLYNLHRKNQRLKNERELEMKVREDSLQTGVNLKHP